MSSISVDAAGSRYQSVGGAPLLLLCDVGHIREDDGEGHGEDPRQRDQSKVAPRQTGKATVTCCQRGRGSAGALLLV